MTARADDTIVRIWTHTVSARDAASYEAQLRDVALPRLKGLDGHLGSQLLLALDSESARFTVVSQWRASAASTMAQIDGPLSSVGTITTQRVVDGRSVDVEMGEVVRVNAIAAEPSGRRRDTLTVVAALVLAAVVVAWLARGDSDSSAVLDSEPEPLAVVTSTVPSGLIDEVFIPWPDPPEDHDPHVSGRPGSGEPISAALTGQTLVYVNDRSRPTLIDLSTGDQRELDIATTRAVDSFLVEGGKVVVDDPLDPDFPLRAGRAFVFNVALDGATELVERGPSPTVCLVADSGCAARPWTTGQFGEVDLGVQSFDGPPLEALAARLGADSWIAGDRWTTFELPLDEGSASVRLPSPAGHAVVWLITEQL